MSIDSKEAARTKIFSEIGLKKYSLTLFITSFLLILTTIALLLPGNDVRLDIGEVTGLNSGWSLTYPQGTMESIDLPSTIDLPKNEIAIIEKTLPEAFRHQQALRLRSSMQHIVVYLEGELIFDNKSLSEPNIFYQPQVSAWHLFSLPEGSQGKRLTIHIASDVGVMSGRINEIYYGQEGDLVGDIIARQPISLGIAIFILMIGLVTTMITVMIRLESVKRLQYLSIFAMTMGLWLISEMDVMQFFTGNSYIVGGISYVVLPVAVIAFMLFLGEVALEKYHKVIRGIIVVVGVYLIFSVFLQLTVNLHYINAFMLFNPLVLVAIVIVSSLFIYERVVYKNQVAWKYFKIIGVLIVTVGVEVAKFFIGDFMAISYFGSFGIAIFLMLLMMDTFKYMDEVLRTEGENRYLKEIAYKDILTGGPNRSLFEKDIDELLASKEKAPFRLVMFDLNNLKLINDQCGHNSGDHALQDFFQSLVAAYSETSTCYRVGGDEFMVIQHSISEECYIEAQLVLKSLMNEIETEKDYLFSCAYGAGIYDYKQKFGDFKHEVDMRMYRLKKEQKKDQKHRSTIDL